MSRGFVSRSVVRDDEGAIFDDKAERPNWHLVNFSDGHRYYWKDDTSSDETTGHFYGLSLYYDLCARSDTERAEVANYVGALATAILDGGLQLLDLDGEPTTHGYWNPERLAIAVDGLEACVESHPPLDCIDAFGGGGFLNSVEILGALLAAWHVTGEARFFRAYETLIEDHRYDEVATFGENNVTWSSRALANYCDHELADLAFLTLLRYEPDPDRRALWIRSMLDAWEWERGERNPLKALAMAAAMAESPGLPEGERTLREYPEDLRELRVDNAHRVDVAPGGSDRFGVAQFDTVLPYDEIYVVRWDENPFRMGADPTFPYVAAYVSHYATALASWGTVRSG